MGLLSLRTRRYSWNKTELSHDALSISTEKVFDLKAFTKCWLSNLGLACASLFFTLILCELIVRYWEYQRGSPVYRNPATTWSDRPSFYYKPDSSPVFQDYKYSKEKPANTYRIGVIGDSFTFTPYLQFDDNFPKRLERMLELNSDSKLRPEVISYSKWGESTQSEIELIDKALAAQADLLILQITLNDARTESYHQLSSKHVNSRYTFGELEITREGTPLLWYWHSAAFIASRIHAAKTRSSYVRFYQDSFSEEETWKEFSEAIITIYKRCTRKKVPLIAVLFPFFEAKLDNTYPYQSAHQKIAALLSSLKIPLLDLRESFSGIPIERLQVIPGQDAHPNEIAQRIASEELYKFMERNGYIPEELQIHDKYRMRIDPKQNRIRHF